MAVISCYAARAVKHSPLANFDVFWIRFFGYGLHFRWIGPGYQPLFSERNGYVRVIKLGRLWIKGLKP